MCTHMGSLWSSHTHARYTINMYVISIGTTATASVSLDEYAKYSTRIAFLFGCTYDNSVRQHIDAILIAWRVDTVPVQPSCRICWRIRTKFHRQMQRRAWIRNRCMISHTNSWRTCNLFRSVSDKPVANELY